MDLSKWMQKFKGSRAEIKFIKGGYSPKDIIEISKSIYKLKINDEWKISEITKNTLDLFNLLNID